MCREKRVAIRNQLYDRTEILVNSDAFKRLFFQNH
jgi:hypothetical protein